jgi:molecular chaperone DnaK
MTAFIGIDLGTTFSAVATIDDTGRPVIIHDSDGQNILPSCVTENDEGEIEVGEYARRTWGYDPKRAAARFKRDIGSTSTQVINDKTFNSTELSSFVLRKLKQIAEKSVGELGAAVVTIPANFSNEAREATMCAAQMSGLNVKYIINEPTAAALYYAFKSGDELGDTYAVYDLGGGTFDISIIQINGQNVDVLSTNGVSRLGGDDFDQALIKLVSAKYKEKTGKQLESYDFDKNDAEEEKKSLSKRKKVTLNVNRQLIDITRDEFEECISTLHMLRKNQHQNSDNMTIFK